MNTLKFLEITSLGDRSDGILHGKKMENTFKLGPDKVFRTCDVEKATEEVLKENLKDVEYNSTKCRELYHCNSKYRFVRKFDTSKIIRVFVP
jgi:hypothetical protein